MSTQKTMASEMARLVRRRRTLWKALVAILVASSILVALLFIWQVQAEEQAEEQSVREDFQNTWCQTFGSDVSDTEVLAKWKTFINRNRGYLESRPELYIETFEGERVLHIEETIDYFIQEPLITPSFVPFEGEIEGSLGFPTVEYLALGKNEFGKPVVLPCR